MSNQFPGQFPLTAPDLVWNTTGGGLVGDVDIFMSETTSEAQNLLQDLTNRLIELPGSNLDFGHVNTRGVGLMLYIQSTTDKLAGLPARIDDEFEQDPRVSSSFTTITLDDTPDGEEPSYTISTTLVAVAGVTGFSWAWSQSGVAPIRGGA